MVHSSSTSQEMTAWIHNNWRLRKAPRQIGVKGKVRVADVVRTTMREAVTAKLKDILGMEDIDPGSPECFQQQNKAVSQVMQDLSDSQHAEMEAMAHQWNTQGSPVEEQRRYHSPAR